METEILGKDILFRNGDIVISPSQDFAVAEGRRNLRQAIENRLKTKLGEYHIKEYGSEIYKVVGKTQSDVLKSRIRGYVYETLLQEPRIDTIENISIEFNSDREIVVDITITIIKTQERMNLIFPNFVL